MAVSSPCASRRRGSDLDGCARSGPPRPRKRPGPKLPETGDRESGSRQRRGTPERDIESRTCDIRRPERLLGERCRSRNGTSGTSRLQGRRDRIRVQGPATIPQIAAGPAENPTVGRANARRPQPSGRDRRETRKRLERRRSKPLSKLSGPTRPPSNDRGSDDSPEPERKPGPKLGKGRTIRKDRRGGFHAVRSSKGDRDTLPSRTRHARLERVARGSAGDGLQGMRCEAPYAHRRKAVRGGGAQAPRPRYGCGFLPRMSRARRLRSKLQPPAERRAGSDFERSSQIRRDARRPAC
jgi:hypothetical protein